MPARLALPHGGGTSPKATGRGLLLALALSACAHAAPAPEAPAPDPLAELDRLELARSLGGGQVAALAHDARPEVRVAALRVLARLQRPEGVEPVVQALADPEPEVRSAAAFAAGQLGLSWQPLPDETLARLATATLGALSKAVPCDPQSARCERYALLPALGKLGRPEAGSALIGLLGESDPRTRREAALALGILGQRTQGKAPGPEAIEPLQKVLLHDEPAVRWAAAYALMRAKRPEARPALTFGLKDGDAGVRAVCARGLADVAEETELSYLVERLGDADLDVRVESARALGKLASKCAATGPCKAADAAGQALATLQKAYNPAKPESGSPLLALAQEQLPAALGPALAKASSLPKATPELARPRAVVACYLAAASDRVRTDGQLPALAACAPTPDLESWREGLAARTLGASLAEPKARALALLALPARTLGAQGAVLDALSELKQDLPEVRARLARDLRSPDYTVALSASDAAAKLGVAALAPELPRVLTLAESNAQDDGVATVLGDLAQLKAPTTAALAQHYLDDPRPTVRAGAIEALKAMNALPATLPEPRPREARDPAPLAAGRKARVRTERGELVIALQPGSRTAAHFAELAGHGFFDMLTWHRVVPGFVVQGGDPRGDGSGGPGYTIPCELGAERYERGAVGMALSGKDTGGSQFFVTLTPQPHLEGRYTIFGRVEQGMDIADRLMEGDLILGVSIE